MQTIIKKAFSLNFLDLVISNIFPHDVGHCSCDQTKMELNFYSFSGKRVLVGVQKREENRKELSVSDFVKSAHGSVSFVLQSGIVHGQSI